MIKQLILDKDSSLFNVIKEYEEILRNSHYKVPTKYPLLISRDGEFKENEEFVKLSEEYIKELSNTQNRSEKTIRKNYKKIIDNKLLGVEVSNLFDLVYGFYPFVSSEIQFDKLMLILIDLAFRNKKEEFSDLMNKLVEFLKQNQSVFAIRLIMKNLQGDIQEIWSNKFLDIISSITETTISWNNQEKKDNSFTIPAEM